MGGRRVRNRGRRTPVPVYNSVNYLEPTATIPVYLAVSGSGVLAVNVPSFFANRPWRLTSIDVSISANNTNGIGSCVVVLFAGVVGASGNGFSEESLRTRRFTVGTAPLNLKIKQAKRVQHVAAAGTVPVVHFEVGTNAVVIDGVANFSIRGAIQ